MSDGPMATSAEELQEQLLARDALIASLREIVQSLEGKNTALNSSLLAYIAENDLLKRRLFGTKSERTNTSEIQLLLAGLFPEDAALRKQLEEALTPGNSGAADDGEPAKTGSGSKDNNPRAKPKGRRDLAASDLPRITVDLDDPALAEKGRLIRHESSFELMRVRGGLRVLEKRTAIYEIEVAGEKTVLSAEQPPRLFPRSLCHTSVYAWLAVEKFALGVPCYRLEQSLETEQESLDRGTMCRYLEELGSTLGATIVEAMFVDARDNCHVLSTDATGAAIQPEPSTDGRSRPARRGTSSRSSPIATTCSSTTPRHTRPKPCGGSSRASPAISSATRLPSTTSSSEASPRSCPRTTRTRSSASSAAGRTAVATSSKRRSRSTALPWRD
jgi:transposase